MRRLIFPDGRLLAEAMNFILQPRLEDGKVPASPVDIRPFRSFHTVFIRENQAFQRRRMDCATPRLSREEEVAALGALIVPLPHRESTSDVLTRAARKRGPAGRRLCDEEKLVVVHAAVFAPFLGPRQRPLRRPLVAQLLQDQSLHPQHGG